jgi:hypothetical protein
LSWVVAAGTALGGKVNVEINAAAQMILDRILGLAGQSNFARVRSDRID